MFVRSATLLLVITAGLLSCLVSGSAMAQQPPSRVFLNNVPTPVYFNDGDSFRVLSGPLANTTARLAGFNTPESYGPTQMWGDFHPREIYFLAKMATLNARRGIWHCTSDLKRDTYGRILWHCPDLAKDQIRKGLAHAMSISQEPAAPEYLEAQREAIAARRGMWSKGVPEFIVTSVHSASESASGGTHYNRLVSTRDGHSLRWEHTNVYQECEDVCFYEVKIDDAVRGAVVAALRQESDLAGMLRSYSDEQLATYISEYARNGKVDSMPDRSHGPLLDARLKAYRDAGRLGELNPGQPSCMTYTDFTRRFGASKAPCLKY